MHAMRVFWCHIPGHPEFNLFFKIHTAIIERPSTGICHSPDTNIVVIELTGLWIRYDSHVVQRPSRRGKDAGMQLTDMNVCH